MALFQPPEPAPALGASRLDPATGVQWRPDFDPAALSSTPPPEARPAAAPRPAAVPRLSLTPPVRPTHRTRLDPPEPSDPRRMSAATLDHEAVLIAALDSLGQAHHRPFSRA